MVDVLLIASGEVDVRVREHLTKLANVSVRTLTVGEAGAVISDESVVVDYVILHDVPLRASKPNANDSLHAMVKSVMSTRPRVPIAVLLETVRDDDLKKAVFVSSVDVGIDLGDDLDRLGNAIDLLERRLDAVASRVSAPPSGAHRIGSLVEVDFEDNSQGDGPPNRPGTAYRMARWRSLMPVDGSTFAQDVRDAVDALARFPLRTNLPWDPLDRPVKPVRKTDLPERQPLKDVMRAFANAEDAKKRLYGTGTPPLSREEARELLAGEPHPREDDAEYQRWRDVWSVGVNPPALLLDGETGVGKTLMAEFITFLLTPTRSDGAGQGLTSRSRFVKANAAGLTVNDFNHQMMGVAPGIWSGIDDAVVGRLPRAAHGVFFLDEVGDMPADVQAAVLTFLDSREIQPTGVDPFKGYQHIIAATNKELEKEVASGSFRQDLLARFPLRLSIPPLRARPKDERERWIDFLAQDPVVNPRIGNTAEYEVTHFSRAALQALADHDYRNGNFRELTERVHASIRSARRNLRSTVLPADIPEPAMSIAAGGDVT